METLSLCLNSLEYMMSPRKMSMVTFISYQPASLTNRESFLLTIDFSLLIHGAFSQIKQ